MHPGSGSVSRTASKVSLLRQLGMDIFNTKCSFGTRFGQTLLLLLLLVAGFLPSSILTVQNFVKLLTTTRTYSKHLFVTEKLAEIDKKLATSKKHNLCLTEIQLQVDNAGNLVYEVQIERGRTTLYLSASKNGSMKALSKVLQQRLTVDKTVDAISLWPEKVAASLGDLESFKRSIYDFRRLVDNSNLTYMRVLAFYSRINQVLIRWMQDIIDEFSTGDRWPELNAYHLITLATEYIGIERARGSVFWNQGYFTQVEFRLFLECVLNGKEYYYEARQFSSVIRALTTRPNITNVLSEIDDLRNVILNNFSAPSVNNATSWFESLTKLIGSIKYAQTELAKDIKRHTIEVGKKAISTIVRTTIVFILELSIYPIYAYLACRLVFQIKRISAKLATRSGTLYKTQRRNKEMLREMYPQKIADRLMKGETVEPEIFEQATVCFIVVSDFDRIMADCSGHDAVVVVNRVFDVMDDEILKYDIFKVETLEDMFLLVSGVPERNGTQHLTEIADLCLNLRSRARSVCLDILPSEGIKLRFGVCTGPVAAGIVGLKMPRYLLFGDTVNMAARMQSTSQPQCIHLSPSSGSLLSIINGYKLEQRHAVEVKGKGTMQTFWLLEKTTSRNSHRVTREDRF